jgi:hypothetical protein
MQDSGSNTVYADTGWTVWTRINTKIAEKCMCHMLLQPKALSPPNMQPAQACHTPAA